MKNLKEMHGKCDFVLHFTLPIFCSVDLNTEVSNLLNASKYSPGNFGFSFGEIISL